MRVWLSICLLGFSVALAADEPLQHLEPRIPAAKPADIERPAHAGVLIVKFLDELKLRSQHGGLVSEVGADVPSVRAVADRHRLDFETLIQLPRYKLDRIEQRAAQRSGIAQPDLAGMMVVHGSAEAVDQAARELLALDAVEWVYFSELAPEPPCSDISPVTPDYYDQGWQSYHGPNPGLDMEYAWSVGARGQGIQIADCEYGYVLGHESLCGVTLESGQTIHPSVIANGWHHHGTAVLGAMVGQGSGYGVTGLVPDATTLFFTEWSSQQGYRRVTAIANAIATVDVGDVVVLEMQANGAGGGYGPAELELAVWNLVKAGTDSGVVVVGAAGNGNQNLDSASYASYLARGDSGAIIVGAGSANTSHYKLSFSTYGSRVDVQGWGESVFTAGYGSFAQHGGQEEQSYVSGFNGTSSATPLVASSAAALQSLALQTHGCVMDSPTLRQLLIDTGVAQGSGGHIGPFPDLQAAADTLLALPDCTYGCGDGQITGSEECDDGNLGGCAVGCDTDCSCLVVGPGGVEDLLVTDYTQAADRMWISWTPSCSAGDHTLISGPLNWLSSYGYTNQVCNLGDAGTHGPFSLGAGDWFFLVVGNDGLVEGSYGTSAGGFERPEQTNDPYCTYPQDISLPCSDF